MVSCSVQRGHHGAAASPIVGMTMLSACTPQDLEPMGEGENIPGRHV